MEKFVDFNKKYEILADLFYRKYGFLPPGKDNRLPLPVDEKERWDLWLDFLKEINNEIKRKEV